MKNIPDLRSIEHEYLIEIILWEEENAGEEETENITILLPVPFHTSASARDSAVS